jgi:acetoin utilization deacetylase AcuC-like enzyme
MTTHDSAAVSSLFLADDERFLDHVAPPEHPERGARLLAVRDGLERAGAATERGDRAHSAYQRLSFGDATPEQLARVHEPAYIEQLGHLAGRTGFLDSDTFLSQGSVPAAFRAAGSAVALVDALIDAEAGSRGIALPRPPGHHALADRAMGFCLLNNVAVAAAHARARGRERVLILDWDVHHGNGTEAMFYGDPSVLFVSLHQYPNYPGTGAHGDVGRGDGRGRNVNVPLPPGGGDEVYAAAFERLVLPIIEQFAPDFALVSCGFDAHALDPLAQMGLSSRAYGAMTSALLQVLPRGPACPVGVVLEGGYDLTALTEASESVALSLLDRPPEPVRHRDPTPPQLPGDATTALLEISRVQSQFWRLG